MTIADRLDRLRGRTPAGTGTGQSATLDDRLRRARGRQGAQVARLSPTPDALAASLGGQVVDGVVPVSRRWLPPAREPFGDDGLDGLPEVLGCGDADWVYLDTETTGLSGGVGTAVFMVGVARRDRLGGLQVRQFVLAGFAAEDAMLRQLVQWIGPHAVVVSYNGRCFDGPLLQARMRLHRVLPDLGGLRQLDLMYTVRRAFRAHWPDCRLQTAERRLLGYVRRDDLPGSEAPAAWHDWLRRGDACMLADVARHNLDDVVTLARLHQRLPGIYAGRHADAVDEGAIGRAWWQAGFDGRALAVWEGGLPRLDERAGLQLAAIYRRAGDWPRAESLWLRLARAGSRSAACELSKYYEHRVRDPRRALRFADGCADSDRTVRLARLRRKLLGGPQLSLWSPTSVANAMK